MTVPTVLTECSPAMAAAWYDVDRAIAAAPSHLSAAAATAVRDVADRTELHPADTMATLVLAVGEAGAVALVRAGYVDADRALRAAPSLPTDGGPLGDPLGWDRFDLTRWGLEAVPLVAIPGRGHLPATLAHQLGALRPDEVRVSALQQPASRAYDGGPVGVALVERLLTPAATALLAAAGAAARGRSSADRRATLDAALRGPVRRVVAAARSREHPTIDAEYWDDDELLGPAVWPCRRVIVEAVKGALPATGFSRPLWELCDPVWAWDAAIRSLLDAALDDPRWPPDAVGSAVRELHDVGPRGRSQVAGS